MLNKISCGLLAILLSSSAFAGNWVKTYHSNETGYMTFIDKSSIVRLDKSALEKFKNHKIYYARTKSINFDEDNIVTSLYDCTNRTYNPLMWVRINKKGKIFSIDGNSVDGVEDSEGWYPPSKDTPQYYKGLKYICG